MFLIMLGLPLISLLAIVFFIKHRVAIALSGTWRLMPNMSAVLEIWEKFY